MARLVHEGDAKIWHSGGPVVYLGRNMFTLLAGVPKRDAIRHGYAIYLAPVKGKKNCLMVAIRRTPPSWARASITISTSPYTFRIPKTLRERLCEASESDASLRIYEDEGGKHAILCWNCG